MPRPRCGLNDVSGETCRKQRRTNSPYCSQKCKSRVHYVKTKLKNQELKPKRPQDSMARGKYYDDFVKEFGEVESEWTLIVFGNDMNASGSAIEPFSTPSPSTVGG